MHTKSIIQLLICSVYKKTAYVAPSLELDLDEVQKTFETNLFSIMRMVQTFSGLLIKSKGTIVNIGTYFPDMPFPFRGKSCIKDYVVYSCL